MPAVREIASAIEEFAPLTLQESYDNAGLQVGNPDMAVSAVLLCLDVTEDVIREAKNRHCNMVVSHHPLLFRGLKEITGKTASERIVIEAIKSNISIYSAHTNLDSAFEGVSYEMAHMLCLENIRSLSSTDSDGRCGLGVVGDIKPTPKLEFLRRVKEVFKMKALRYSAQSPQIVVRKVALCGGAGMSLVGDALREGADVFVTGDVKYHDFTTYGLDILLADTGHFESEMCSTRILSRIIRDKWPDCITYFSEAESNPVQYM